MGARKRKLFINHDLIADKIADIEKAMALLEKIASVEKKGFLTDQIIISGAKYQLILAIEAAQNICNHLAARVAKEAPESYAGCFRILGENNIIPEEMAVKLAAMAKFRNLLVHRYGRVDDSLVYKIVKDDIKDLLDFISEVKTFLMSVLAGE